MERFSTASQDKIRAVPSGAGLALKQVLDQYEITQNKLADTMGISRSNIHRWINEIGDPLGDKIVAIRDALQEINPEAAEKFVWLYVTDRPCFAPRAQKFPLKLSYR